MTAKNLTNNKGNVIQRALYILTVSMVLVFMAYSQWVFTTRDVIMVTFLHFCLLIVFLTTMNKTDKKLLSIVLLVCILLTLFSAGYILVNLEHLLINRWNNTMLDLIVGAILIALVFYAGILCFGRLIPVMVMVVMIYPFFGQYLPEPFTTTAYSIPKTISNLAIALDTGVFDTPLRVAVNYVFLFIVFGSILSSTKVSDFFFELGKLLFGKLISGPALIATINSALVGSVVGSAVANVTITGVYTIPAMKKAGYKPERAAAIEAAASNGGQILPPVMGVIAFAMAGFAGIPYLRICAMALMPALLYYMCVGAYCHLSALKNPVLRERKIEKQTIDYDLMRYKAPSFVIPLVLIMYLLWKGYSVSFVAFWAIICVLVVSNLVPKKYRPNFKDVLDGFLEGGISGAKIGSISAVIGIMLATFTGSGMGIKLSIGIGTWSGGVLFFALLIIWVVCVLLGMIGVSAVAYYTTAAFAVPVLVKMGMAYETSHFFIVFPTAFALITPPIATVSIVASQLAEADYMKTAIEAVKASAAAFILPFLFAYSPTLLMQISVFTAEYWLDLTAIIFALLALQVIGASYLLTDVNILEKLLLICASAMLILYIPLNSAFLYVFGVAAAIAVVLMQVSKVKKISSSIQAEI
jgi:TRAP transporter 4TM/12TM fusion protein